MGTKTGVESSIRQSGRAAGRYGDSSGSTIDIRRKKRSVGSGRVRDEELEVLRITCGRLKEELDLPVDFEYEDVGTYAKGELAAAKAGLAEAERQNEILEAERSLQSSCIEKCKLRMCSYATT